jgi:hypothetical protein
VHVLLLLSKGLLASLERREPSSDGSGLLSSHVKWQVLFALVSLSDLVSLLVVDDRLDARDRLSHGLDLCKLRRSTPSDLCHTQSRQLSLELVESLLELTLGLFSEFVCLHHLYAQSGRGEGRKGGHILKLATYVGSDPHE